LTLVTLQQVPPSGKGALASEAEPAPESPAAEMLGATAASLVAEVAARAATAEGDGFAAPVGFDAGAVLAAYEEAMPGTDAAEAARHVFTDKTAALASLRSADAHARASGGRTFHYRFDYGAARVEGAAVPYARRGTDIGFWFATAGRFPDEVGLADHQPHAEQVRPSERGGGGRKRARTTPAVSAACQSRLPQSPVTATWPPPAGLICSRASERASAPC
jgi:hypothetical protein